MARITKLNLNNTDYAIGTEYVGSSNTNSTTNVKAVTLLNTTGFELKDGTVIHVILNNNHTSGANMQLNVAGTGAITVRTKYGKNVTYLARGYYSFVYWGNLWYINGKAFGELQIDGTGDAVVNIDAMDWTNGIKVTKGNVEAFHSTPLSQVSTSTSMDRLTGNGDLAKFWTGAYGDTMEIGVADGTLDFNLINTNTISRNRRFHIYVFGGVEFKMLGCITNIDTQGVINPKYPVLLKCWYGQKASSLYYWCVEVTQFLYSW